MKTIEKIFFALFPRLLLKGTPWEKIWDDQERAEFISAAKVFFVIVGFAYILHYYTVDRDEGLAPSDLWFNYRFGMATLCFTAFMYYATSLQKVFKSFRFPFVLSSFVLVYFQAQTMLWYSKVPYFYVFCFVFIASYMLKMSILPSVLFGVGLLVPVWQTLLISGQSPGMMFSAALVTMMFITFARTNYLSDIKLFLANQKNFDQQKKMIELNVEFTNQVKAFLPSEISQRLTDFVQVRRMNIVQAVDEVLRPRKLPIACLFSDIRGFTKSSNDLNGFVQQAMLPDLKASTEAIEYYHGIPRKIGDLLFAYYDKTDIEQNIRNVLFSALEMSKINKEQSLRLPESIRLKRYILISCGEALVGNLGGFDSAIEITAIGRPVNLLSRIDEATKSPIIKELVQSGDIVMTAEIAAYLQNSYPDIDLREMKINSLDIKIRDFEEIVSLYVLPYSAEAYNLLSQNLPETNSFRMSEVA